MHAYAHDPRATSYGLEAAEALGVDPDRVFKTLMIEADGSLAVVVVPVSGTVDLKAAASALGAKRAQLADPAAAQRATGYVLGGISPIGQKRRHRTVIDETAELWESVLVSGGRRGLDVELSPRDLIDLTQGIVAAVGR
ncbi:MAG: Cys-tRNA(Pro) deacylase [Aeromicrobium sp.]|uniref:Cys-tRNA(Pro) deacylase n=1 Tax=Aeromicrobium sp. TaxID=1871063 RepID=UPI0025C17F66|nr:Cys-tRNA(Pro) deacylase [Aeromicrobium sp.]MDF1703411.1 Cys-tRNA(Pro) deacylase [Aeromicrobium sp.]